MLAGLSGIATPRVWTDGCPAHSVVVGYAGRLHFDKNPLLFVRAAALVRAETLLRVASARLHPPHEALAEAEALRRCAHEQNGFGESAAAMLCYYESSLLDPRIASLLSYANMALKLGQPRAAMLIYGLAMGVTP